MQAMPTDLNHELLHLTAIRLVRSFAFHFSFLSLVCLEAVLPVFVTAATMWSIDLSFPVCREADGPGLLLEFHLGIL